MHRSNKNTFSNAWLGAWKINGTYCQDSRGAFRLLFIYFFFFFLVAPVPEGHLHSTAHSTLLNFSADLAVLASPFTPFWTWSLSVLFIPETGACDRPSHLSGRFAGLFRLGADGWNTWNCHFCPGEKTISNPSFRYLWRGQLPAFVT